MIARFGAGIMGQTAALGTTTAINTAGTMGGNWMSGQGNGNVGGTIAGSVISYPIGSYFATRNPVLSNAITSAAQELINWAINNQATPNQSSGN